ncbi:MAG TPA: hypothetical protein VFT80_06785 [Actinomycetota bacterium]|nr:hypothetical protein [Actinomycetota bacterium]
MRAIARVLVVAAAVVLVGCSGDDGSGGDTMTAEEYFAELESIGRSAQDDFARLEQRFTDAQQMATSEEEISVALQAFLQGVSARSRTALDDVRALSPPEEVADAHAEFADAFGSSTEFFEGLTEDYERLGAEGVMTSLQGEFETLERAQDEACTTLQTFADDEGIDVDLDCGP